MTENQKRRPPAIPPGLLNTPRPRGVIAAEKHLNEVIERKAQANVDAVEILLAHRDALAGLKELADLDLHKELKDVLSQFIVIADRALIAARG
jgi:hypothetical protein